jgi:hypothetical protein
MILRDLLALFIVTKDKVSGKQETESAPCPRPEMDRWLWLMVILGVLTIAIFGFGVDTRPFQSVVRDFSSRGWLISAPSWPPHWDHWRSWEMGAVIWSILFGLYYYVRFPFVPNQASNKVICAVVVVGAVVPNVFAASFILNMKPPLFHVSAVMAASVFFTVADYLLYREHTNPRQKGSFFEGLLMADFPMTVGSAVLLLYLSFHSECENMDAFTGGAITFQLLASNVIFVLGQGGFIRWVWERHLLQMHNLPGKPSGESASGKEQNAAVRSVSV